MSRRVGNHHFFDSRWERTVVPLIEEKFLQTCKGGEIMKTKLKTHTVERRAVSKAIEQRHRLSAFAADPQLSNSGVCKICTASSGVASQ